MPTELLEPRTVKRKPLAADCLRFRCPACAKPIRAKTSAAGKRGRCPSCREALTFPQAAFPQAEGARPSAPEAKPVRQARGRPAAGAPMAKPAAAAKALTDRTPAAPKADRPLPKARRLHETRSERPLPVPSVERTSPSSAAHTRRGPSPAVMALVFATGLALGAAGGRWSVSPGSPFAASPDTNVPAVPPSQPDKAPAAREFSPGEPREAPAVSAPHTRAPLPTASNMTQAPAQAEVPAPEPKAVARAETAEPAEAAAREMPEEPSPASAVLDMAPAEMPAAADAPAVSKAIKAAPAPAAETVLKHAPDEETPEQPQVIPGEPEAVVEAPATQKAEPAETNVANVGEKPAEPAKPAAVPAEPSVAQEPAKPGTPKHAEPTAEAPAAKPAEGSTAKVPEALAAPRRFANARDLHEAVDTRYQGDDGQWRTTLVLTNKRGEKRVRELQRFRKEENRLAKVLLFYLAPSDIKGTSTLTIEQEGDDDMQRMWLPALKKNRRIAGSDKGKSWAGTDFTYEDLRERKVEDYSYGALSEETIDGQPCWRYELKPVTEDKSSYGRIEQWVRKDNLEPIYVKFYDKKDRFFKELRFRRLVKVQGVWASLHWEMINHEDEHKTEFFVTRARYNQGLGEDHFSPRAMTELPGDFEGESFEWGSK